MWTLDEMGSSAQHQPMSVRILATCRQVLELEESVNLKAEACEKLESRVAELTAERDRARWDDVIQRASYDLLQFHTCRINLPLWSHCSYRFEAAQAKHWAKAAEAAARAQVATAFADRDVLLAAATEGSPAALGGGRGAVFGGQLGEEESPSEGGGGRMNGDRRLSFFADADDDWAKVWGVLQV